jgi:quinoprotein glucose dehydrogenase
MVLDSRLILKDRFMEWRYDRSFGWYTLIVAALVLFTSCKSGVMHDVDWSVYGGSNELNRYSALNQIDTNNVKDLEVAWIYHSRDTGLMEINPLIIDNILYGVTSRLKLFAADATTGKEKWVFDPGVDASNPENREGFGINACRGIAFYKDKDAGGIIFYTVGSSLYSISALTGEPMSTFGNKGIVSLYDNLEPYRDIRKLRVTSTSPATIYKDLIIVGTSLSENAEAAPGHIRAYDVHTGQLKWTFYTIPRPGEVGYNTWEDSTAYRYGGGANAWAGFSLDEKRGILYASTGTTNPDFYGGKRKGDNLFGNSIIALDAATGQRRWHYQVVHHDLWDYDLPTPPILVSVKVKNKGEKVDAVLQLTKHGMIFMLDRVTGKPIYPIEERPVPIYSELKGEQLSPTQPFPTFFEPFARQEFTESDLNTIIPDSSYQDIKRRFRTYKSGPIFTPPTIQGTIVFPGLNGGVNWGGGSFDPATGVLYVNVNEMPWIVTMIDTKNGDMTPYMLANRTNLQAGTSLYKSNCMGCHGAEMKGVGDIPSLVDVKSKYTKSEFESLISSGKRMMPAFSSLSKAEKTAIASFVLDLKTIQNKKFLGVTKAKSPFYDAPYKNQGIQQFLSKEGYPAVSPPWGNLSAINLNTGKLVWKNTFGDYPELLKTKNIHSGGESWGGSVVTAGGLLFIAATMDEKFRAFNKRTGELLFETELPAGGYATPSVYRVNGKEYIVIACGGGRMKSKPGDSYVAFTLPGKQ